MTTALMHKEESIKIKQYITDPEGHKVAAVIDLEELNRLEALIAVIPSSEIWLYQNKDALQSVCQGLQDAAAGRVSILNFDEF